MTQAPEALVKITNLKSLRNLVKAIDRRDSYTRFHSDHATHLAVELANARHSMPSTDERDHHRQARSTTSARSSCRTRSCGSRGRLRPRAPHDGGASVIGAAITAAVTDYDTVVDLVRHHHERFDGNGYPGTCGRADHAAHAHLRLADAYSAMTTDRPYRKGLTCEQALAQIIAGRAGNSTRTSGWRS